jgi:hypothetical protein
MNGSEFLSQKDQTPPLGRGDKLWTRGAIKICVAQVREEENIGLYGRDPKQFGRIKRRCTAGTLKQLCIVLNFKIADDLCQNIFLA